MNYDLLCCDIHERSVRHVVGQVQAAPVSDYPFPHIVIERFFPDDVYERLLASFPDPDRYRPFDAGKHQSAMGDSNRDHFQLSDANLNRLPADRAAFWLAVRRTLGSRELKEQVFAKFAPALAFRFGVTPAEAGRMEGHPLPELFRERSGYRIKPHPDTRKKLVTMQISLPSDATQADLGTVFYRRSMNPSAYLRQPWGFESVKQMPFLPNTAYAFCVLNTLSKKSWHGRDTLRADCGVRNTILNIYYARAEHGSQDIERDRTAAMPTAA